MASSSQAVPATTNAAIITSETIVGSHVFTINGFSATKNLGVGKSNKSSVFRVGGHALYIECYPCGDVEDSAGWVTLYLCRQEDHPGSRVSGQCKFTLMESLKDGLFSKLIPRTRTNKLVTIEDDGSLWLSGTDFIKREKLESLLTDDCFHVRCIVFIKEFPPVPQPDLATKTVSGSHVLTVEGYTKTREAVAVGEAICSSLFCIGGHDWFIAFYPCGKVEVEADGVTTYFGLGGADANDQVKVRFEISLLTGAGQIITSFQNFHTFTERNNGCFSYFLGGLEHQSSSLLQDCIRIRCDMTVVQEITAVQSPPERPDLRRHLGHLLLASQVGTDVTFEVNGQLFPAHKSVLAIRSTAFMAEFYGQAGNNARVTQVLRIDDMEPRVFKALLHFIYTDALPEVREEDKLVLAQGLLVAADRYAMERLKLICAEMLSSCIDATTAIATRELADKHGCVKLKEACIKVVRDWLANATP